MSDEEKRFNRQEAEQLLPTIAALLEAARDKKSKAEVIEEEFTQIHQRILLHGGIVPPYAHLAEKKLERERYLEAIRDAIAHIEKTGCVVKDLDQGLVDFPAVVNDEQAYLCWKLGEDRIRYWHHADEGFAGRKPIEPDVGPPTERRKPN